MTLPVATRAWHSTVMQNMPAPPDDQFCGVAGQSVLTATEQLLASRPDAMVELDLSKAFDTVWPEVGIAALRHLRAPAHYFCNAEDRRVGPSYGTVNGEISKPIKPTRGLPQGDPASQLGLGAVLGPWAAQIRAKCEGIRPWTYMDRTMSSHDTTADQMEKARDLTSRFDQAVGLEQNASKEQNWTRGTGDSFEHLGFDSCPRRGRCSSSKSCG